MADIWDLAPKVGGDVWDLAPRVGTTPASQKQAQDWADAMLSGLQGSSAGLIARGKKPDTVLREDAPWYHRAAANAGSVVGDIPAIVAGAFAGQSAGAAVGAVAGPGGAAAGSVAGGFMGAFAVPMAIRSALIEAYANNHALSWEGVWEVAKAGLVGGAKGAVIGAATMGVGRLAGNVVAPAAGRSVLAGNMTAQGARRTVDATVTAAELATMTTTAAALDGHMPTWQDFMDNAVLLGGVKAVTGVARAMQNAYAETGKTPAEILADARRDPTIALDLKPVEGASGSKDVVTVYHGSPHVFDKFDISKIGTGEGVQAYGHGLYFAENPKVSESYSGASITGSHPALVVGGKEFAYESPVAQTLIGSGWKTIGEARTRLREVEAEFKDGRFAKQLEVLKDFSDEARIDVGAMYRVEIPKSVVDGMLDWDKPLNEQSANVRAALAKLGVAVGDPRYATTLGADIVRNLIAVAQEKAAPTQRLWWEGAPTASGAKAAVSAAMREAGIPGIKYLDQGSRAAGKGTRNFVLFDAEHARIVERNGQPMGSTEVPRSYKPLALEERIKAAVANVDQAALAKAVADVATGKTEFDTKRAPVAYEYITDAETVKGVIRTVADSSKEAIEAQKRGVVHDETALTEAKRMLERGDLERQKRGEADSVEESAARAFLVRGAAERARELAEKFDNTPAAERTLMQELELHASIQQVGLFLSEFGAGVGEAARTLRMAGEIKRNPEKLGFARELLDQYNKNGKNAGDLAELVRNLKDPERIAKFAEGVRDAPTWKKVMEVYRANIYSGPLTAGANILGNLGRLASDSVSSPLSAIMTAAERAAQNDPINMAQFKARAFAPLIGMTLGIKDGIIAAGETLRGQQTHADKVELTRVLNEGVPVVGWWVKTVFSTLQAGDMLFRVPGERAKAYIMAVDRVTKEGIHPESAEGLARITKYTDDPTLGLNEKAAQKVTAEIEQAGAEAVFSEKLGPNFQKLQSVVSNTPLGFVLPAFRTPVNLLSYAVQHIPGLNFMSSRWLADFKAGGELRDRAVARVVVGAGLMVWAYSMFEDGRLTGGGLFDKEQSGTKVAAGQQPYSIRMGDKYYSLERLEPIAKPLMLAADIMEMTKAAKIKTPDGQVSMDKAMFMGIMAFANITVSTTYLSSLSNLMKASQEPDRYATNFFESYGAAIVPKVVGQTVQLADPYKREVDGILQAMQSQMPGLREKLLPKIDVFGAPVKQGKLFSVLPVATSEASKEKVRSEALRLQLAIAEAPKDVQEKGPLPERERQIRLTQEQRNEFKGERGKLAMSILSPMVNSPEWDTYSDLAQAAVYKRVFEMTTKVAEQKALPMDAPERQKLREVIINKMQNPTKKVLRFDASGELE